MMFSSIFVPIMFLYRDAMFVLFFVSIMFLGAKKRLYKRLRQSVRWSVRPLVGRSVCPHDAITWKTGYVAIALRGGEGRGN
jgi:hypothetical protein